MTAHELRSNVSQKLGVRAMRNYWIFRSRILGHRAALHGWMVCMLVSASKLRSQFLFSQVLLWVFGIGVLLLPVKALSQTPSTLVVQQSYYEDVSGTLTFNQVRHKQFIPYQGILTKGYSSAVYWLKLRIDPRLADASAASNSERVFSSISDRATQSAGDLVLRVRPPFLDDIRLYDPLVGTDRDRVTGDRYAWLAGEFFSLNHGFLLPRGIEPRDVWLRVQSTSTMLVGVDVLPLPVMQALERRQELINNLDVVLIVSFFLWGVLLFFSRPDRVVGAFLLVMMASFFYATNYMGYYRIFFGESLPLGFSDHAHTVLVMLVPPAYMLFHRRLLSEYQPRPWMMKILLPAQYYFLLGLALAYLGFTTLAVGINALLMVLSLLWICVILLFGVRWESATVDRVGPIGRGWLLLFYATLTVVFGLLVLPAHGLVEAFQGALYRSIFQGLISFGSLAGIVHVRGKMLEQQRLLELANAEQAAAFEKLKRQEREEFFSMLTHEIRTPLTVMAYAAKTDMPDGQLSQHVSSGIQEIDEIIERCLQADRADQDGLPVDPSPITLGSIIDGLSARFSSAKVEWQLDVSREAVLTTDEALLEVVLNNLLDNAVKYSAADTSIAVGISAKSVDQSPGLAIAVRNKPGLAGMPDAARVFDRYYRSPRARIRTGSGLGLYVAKSFAMRLGGELRCHPMDDCVCFELWLPL